MKRSELKKLLSKALAAQFGSAVCGSGLNDIGVIANSCDEDMTEKTRVVGSGHISLFVYSPFELPRPFSVLLRFTCGRCVFADGEPDVHDIHIKGEVNPHPMPDCVGTELQSIRFLVKSAGHGVCALFMNSAKVNLGFTVLPRN